jgi:hypothetical protein
MWFLDSSNFQAYETIFKQLNKSLMSHTTNVATPDVDDILLSYPGSKKNS